MLKFNPSEYVHTLVFANNQKGKSLEDWWLLPLRISQSEAKVVLIPYYSLVEDQGKYLV